MSVKATPYQMLARSDARMIEDLTQIIEELSATADTVWTRATFFLLGMIAGVSITWLILESRTWLM